MISHCSGPHNCGGTIKAEGAFAGVFQLRNGKIHKAEIYGERFDTADEMFTAIKAKGYGSYYFPRSSVPMPLFAKLTHHLRQARFDALYRYLKHLKRTGQTYGHIEHRVKRLAKAVGIFHPVASAMNRKDGSR